ncbi:ATP-binding protein [Frankia sp. Cj3]|uniref:ATP-binding protein n=1 Tax=Frankia sp. Cj3 TaxID=2880976 RepID=UPI00351CC023
MAAHPRKPQSRSQRRDSAWPGAVTPPEQLLSRSRHLAFTHGPGPRHALPRHHRILTTEREEKASIACASNSPFSEWGNTFIDPRLAAAVVDQLTYRAHIIQTGTDSYRLRTTRALRNAEAAPGR